MTSPQKLGDRLMHAKREVKALTAKLQDQQAAADILAAFEKSVYMPAVVDRRGLFEKIRDKYNG